MYLHFPVTHKFAFSWLHKRLTSILAIKLAFSTSFGAYVIIENVRPVNWIIEGMNVHSERGLTSGMLLWGILMTNSKAPPPAASQTTLSLRKGCYMF
jgi:hypothetical protein